jgi:hypothetical protein
MIFVLGLLVLVASSLVIIVNGLVKAPEAYEDEDGFHAIRERAPRSSASVVRRHSRQVRFRSTKTEHGAGLHLHLPAAVGRTK